MSEAIKHECGIALIRLRKPYQYYIDKYGTPMYGANKLYLLMEKQHNRGQDGVGVANIKLKVKPGERYISRYRSIDDRPIAKVFKKIGKKFRKAYKAYPEKYRDANWLQTNVAFSGELWLGHLRYGTHGRNSIESCHPMLRQNNWRSRNLVVAGNFNMTNVDELFAKLVNIGQHPKEIADTVTVMEKIGHFLDEENQRQFDYWKGLYENPQLSEVIEREMDLARVLQRSCRDFDGGYTMAGMTGYGAAFVARDPSGIRPAYYYADDEVVVVASEKPAIKTAFNARYEDIKEVEPGHALLIKQDGEYDMVPFTDALPKTPCSFERIYFSRGNDPEIYQERKKLGHLLSKPILKTIDYDLENTLFAYIPNTAETAFLGLSEGIRDYLTDFRRQVIKEGSEEEIERALSLKPRFEKVVVKDAKLRTFITDDSHRDDLVTHIYDATYEVVRKGTDTLVVIDDSIVRGTTLERSLLTMLEKLEPKRIIIVSSAPQIRYPDCYGIDMSRMREFVAFRAMLALLKETKQENKLDEVYEKCVNALNQSRGHEQNFVKELYDLFTYEQVSNKIAEIVTPKGAKAKVDVIYQTVEHLHEACPNHKGDWYFTGDYPTPGGYKVVNRAFVNFMEGKTGRAYEAPAEPGSVPLKVSVGVSDGA
ncbi:amidophosphoribosyltransferase [Catalinimonas alkaloidigena]|uniref:Amidophosphoribosyltransferase n=1 Tax=Catalinimonas alkaloidigena TaxID=1075417 RepID=A0A1G9RFX7_9BACT|nr:amidophosphoribosyltransferase [Catalinimonas alkaloidigena]SDM22081.1 amidophosphoribosyltransferase [Catalinimonas alkaloidigena]